MAKEKIIKSQELEQQTSGTENTSQNNQTTDNAEQTILASTINIGNVEANLAEANFFNNEEITDTQKDFQELLQRINKIIEQGDANRLMNALALNNNEKDVEANVRDKNDTTNETNVEPNNTPNNNIDTQVIVDNQNEVEQFLSNLNQILQEVESSLKQAALNLNEANVNADVREKDENVDATTADTDTTNPEDSLNTTQIVENENDVQEFIDNLNQIINEIESTSGFNQLNNNEGEVEATTREKEDITSEPETQNSALGIKDNETNVEADTREPELPQKEPEPEPEVFIPEQEIETTMTISDVTIEEGSTAVFDVVLSEPSNKAYKVFFNTTTNGTAEAEDINSTIVVKDSLGNIISANSDGSYNVPVGEINLKVEVQTNDDNVYEGAETFELNGKTQYMDSEVQGVGTIKDDGTASDGDDTNDIGPNLDPNSSDDDRFVTVTSLGDVNENSPFAMFKVESNPGQELTLELNNGTATLTNETIEFSYDGTNWTTYNSLTLPTVPSNGVFYVRNTIDSEKDAPFEGSEDFSLKASFEADSSVTGNDSTLIHDDGEKNKFTGNVDPTNDIPETDNTNLDDDREINATDDVGTIDANNTLNVSEADGVIKLASNPDIDTDGNYLTDPNYLRITGNQNWWRR